MGGSRDNPGASYTRADQSFLQNLADRAALAIANARLFDSLKKELSERKRVEKSLRLKDYAIESSVNAIAFAYLRGNLTYVNTSILIGGDTATRRRSWEGL